MERKTRRRMQTQIKETDRVALTASIGKVIDDSPFVVRIANVDHGDSTGPAPTSLEKLGSYTPTIGDVVVVLRRGKHLICLGEIA